VTSTFERLQIQIRFNPLMFERISLLRFYDNSAEIIGYSLRYTFYLDIFVLIRIVISTELLQVASSPITINL
jgi:hypothetical protein